MKNSTLLLISAGVLFYLITRRKASDSTVAVPYYLAAPDEAAPDTVPWRPLIVA